MCENGAPVAGSRPPQPPLLSPRRVPGPGGPGTPWMTCVPARRLAHPRGLYARVSRRLAPPGSSGSSAALAPALERQGLHLVALRKGQEEVATDRHRVPSRAGLSEALRGIF